MKIRSWWWKNYKSYGNVKHSITLGDEGELVLLVGKNGSGKSSALTALDLAVFGEEHNKRGKKLPKANFPNRTNSGLEVGVILDTDEQLQIKRTMESVSSPIKTHLSIDNIPYAKAGKIDQKIIEKIGLDYSTFKSIISMNVNNFRNFISMTPEEKRMLLDKLFTLEEINDLNKILKQLQKNNDINVSGLSRELQIYRDNIEELRESVQRLTEKKKTNNDERLTEIAQLLADYEEQFLTVDDQKNELDELIIEFQNGIAKLETKRSNISRDYRSTEEKIALYKSGKCPTCHSDLSAELDIIPELEEKLEALNSVDASVMTKITEAKKELSELRTEFNTITQELQKILSDASALKSERKLLKSEKTDDLDEFEINIRSNEEKLEEKSTEYIELQKMKFVYDTLLPIWGENGVKRDFINSVLDPINAYIKEDLEQLRMYFKVELDNNFDAHIYEFNNEIDPETLSSGESKRINLIIMLAYIKILRQRKDMNILILDEVFTTIDLEGIDDILMLLKAFAHERKINIFLVHHTELKEWFFDKIIAVNKTTFSNMTTIQRT